MKTIVRPARPSAALVLEEYLAFGNPKCTENQWEDIRNQRLIVYRRMRDLHGDVLVNFRILSLRKGNGKNICGKENTRYIVTNIFGTPQYLYEEVHLYCLN